MKILAITGNPKKKGALVTLTDEAVKGAKKAGAKVEKIRIADKDIRYCMFCMKCKEDIDSRITPCSQKDDMGEILEKIDKADGFVLTCPTSGGHPNAIMKTFIERVAWPLWRPSRNISRVIGWQESRIKDKQRFAVTITTAGGVPAWAKVIINGSTREMAALARDQFHAKTVGRLFVGLLFYRGLSDEDKKEANELGKLLVESIESGR